MTAITNRGGIATINLGRGLVALIDAEDAERVLPLTWHATLRAKVWYARHHHVVDGALSGVYLHRFILNPPRGTRIDHANRDGLDCRRANLRFCTASQNAANSVNRPTPQAYRGVHASTAGGWEAKLTCNGRRVYLGTFRTPEKAAAAYDAAATECFGVFATLNFPAGEIA